jgi:acrylyl-CoA reductase (NADPH)
MCPLSLRRPAWARLVRDLPSATLERLAQTISLTEVPPLAEAILAGQVRGRIVVDPNR